LPGVKVPVAAPSWTDARASWERRRRVRPRAAGKAWAAGRSAATSAGAGAGAPLALDVADVVEAAVVWDAGEVELGDDEPQAARRTADRIPRPARRTAPKRTSLERPANARCLHVKIL
jgi:hypothetical protein